ncbi:MAG: acyltransferase family protein [Limisphaerales bacterium]
MSNATGPITSPAASMPASTQPIPQRLMSLDALRGFDMFWIAAAEPLVAALGKIIQANGHQGVGLSVVGFVAYELDHAEWQGFHFEDLIFPLFVFMAGISIVFSLRKTIQREGRSKAVARVLRRGVLLYLLGIFYYGGFSEPWPHLRLMGVLQRIGLCYMCAGLMFCFFNLRAMMAIAAALLLGYWALVMWVPIRDIQLQKDALAALAAKRGVANDPEALFQSTTERVKGRLDPGLNVPNHFDFQHLPGFKWDTYYDPEGILSTLPAIVTCLLGVFAGLLLLDPSRNDQQKFVLLLACGLGLVALGWAWGSQFPVIKKLWTSSYVLVAGGYSALLLAVFYLIVDMLKIQLWCQPFVWMGMNSITIYMAGNILGGFGKLASRFVGGDISAWFDQRLMGSGDLVGALMEMVLAFWLVHFLYRRKIFLRL